MAPPERQLKVRTPGALVHLPRQTPPDEGPLADPRLGDVDEWGRSEHIRELTRRLYDPLYRHWFRAEWEGLDKVPKTGGALIVANHAGAIPSDASGIMHGIEAMPVLWKVPRLSQMLGVPYVPITANMLVLGPVLGLVVPFPAKFRLTVLDPVHFDVPPDQERYSKSRVMEEADDIRVRLQEKVYEMLRARKSVWFG